MKGIVCICLFALVATTLALPHGEHGDHADDHYTDKYDSVNVDEILKNERLFDPYMNCILEVTNKCAPDAKELKSHIKEALETDCEKCTSKQKEKTDDVIKYIINNKKADWVKLKAKYDPDNKYSKKYEHRLAAVEA